MSYRILNVVHDCAGEKESLALEPTGCVISMSSWKIVLSLMYTLDI